MQVAIGGRISGRSREKTGLPKYPFSLLPATSLDWQAVVGFHPIQDPNSHRRACESCGHRGFTDGKREKNQVKPKKRESTYSLTGMNPPTSVNAISIISGTKSETATDKFMMIKTL